MKKQLIACLILIGSNIQLNAQIYTPSGIVQGSSGSNNVGIGISNPLTPLHLYTNQTTETNILTLQNTGAWGNKQLHSMIWKDQSNCITGGIGLQYDGIGNVDFKIHSLYNGGYKTSSSVVFIVKGTGNVGIGTTSPGKMLTVAGQAWINRQISKIDNGNAIEFGGRVEFNNEQWNTGTASYLVIRNPDTETVRFGADYDGHLGGSLMNIQFGTTNIPYLHIQNNGYNAGNIGIGTTNPEAKLTVKGKIIASEIQVKDISSIPNYVFKSDYQLMTLSRVEEFVKQNQHLPEMPSEKEFKENGMNVAEMNALLLKKIEELTLYAIEQNKVIEEIKQTLKNQNKKIEK